MIELRRCSAWADQPNCLDHWDAAAGAFNWPEGWPEGMAWDGDEVPLPAAAAPPRQGSPTLLHNMLANSLDNDRHT